MTNIFYFSHFSRYVIGGSVLSCFSRVCLFATPWTVALQAPLGRRRDPSWDSPGKNTGVGSLSLFQGIFPTQELNWGLLHCRRTLYQPSYQGSPRNHWHTLILPSFTDTVFSTIWRQLWIKQVYWHYFSNCISSLYVSVSNEVIWQYFKLFHHHYYFML